MMMYVLLIIMFNIKIKVMEAKIIIIVIVMTLLLMIIDIIINNDDNMSTS